MTRAGMLGLGLKAKIFGLGLGLAARGLRVCLGLAKCLKLELET